MIKKTIYAFVFTLAVAACSSDEIADNQLIATDDPNGELVVESSSAGDVADDTGETVIIETTTTIIEASDAPVEETVTTTEGTTTTAGEVTTTEGGSATEGTTTTETTTTTEGEGTTTTLPFETETTDTTVERSLTLQEVVNLDVSPISDIVIREAEILIALQINNIEGCQLLINEISLSESTASFLEELDKLIESDSNESSQAQSIRTDMDSLESALDTCRSGESVSVSELDNFNEIIVRVAPLLN